MQSDKVNELTAAGRPLACYKSCPESLQHPLSMLEKMYACAESWLPCPGQCWDVRCSPLCYQTASLLSGMTQGETSPQQLSQLPVWNLYGHGKEIGRMEDRAGVQDTHFRSCCCINLPQKPGVCFLLLYPK